MPVEFSEEFELLCEDLLRAMWQRLIPLVSAATRRQCRPAMAWRPRL